jgi:hypothetical protein
MMNPHSCYISHTNLLIMKFPTVTHTAFWAAAVTSALGQTIISPTPGQVLPANKVCMIIIILMEFSTLMRLAVLQPHLRLSALL